MKRTELAHWRYRAKALPADLVVTRTALEGAYQLRSMGADKISDRQVQRIKDCLDLQVWLLEEARYKSELGSA